jgi:hypothetical protein
MIICAKKDFVAHGWQQKTRVASKLSPHEVLCQCPVIATIELFYMQKGLLSHVISVLTISATQSSKIGFGLDVDVLCTQAREKAHNRRTFSVV